MSETKELPPRRRDEDSDWHVLVSITCANCGCTQYEAKDDPDIVWEPGRAWDEECKNRSCSCHTDPVIGAHRG